MIFSHRVSLKNCSLSVCFTVESDLKKIHKTPAKPENQKQPFNFAMNCDSVQPLCGTTSLDAVSAEMCCAGLLKSGFTWVASFWPYLLSFGLISALAFLVKAKGLKCVIFQIVNVYGIVRDLFRQPVPEYFDNPTTNADSQRFSVETSVSSGPLTIYGGECEEFEKDEVKTEEGVDEKVVKIEVTSDIISL